MIIRLLLLLPVLLPLCCYAQYQGGTQDGVALQTAANNNPLPNIFYGGAGGGYGTKVIQVQNPGANIYGGGTNDGAASAFGPLQNILPGIYQGGKQSGFASMAVAFQNVSDNLYMGGINDGFGSANVSVQNAFPSIYTGGTSDGVALSFVLNNNPLPDIYAGGGDDGYSSFANNPHQNPPPLKYTDVAAANKGLPVLVVHPNPSSGHFILSIPAVQASYRGYEYIVRTAEGRLVLKGAINSAQTAFNLSTKAAGTYFLSVLKDGKPCENFTIVIAY